MAESNTGDEEGEEKLDRKDILNSSNLDESLVMIKSLLHLTSSLQEDDTSNMLTKVCHKFLQLKNEKVSLNSRQTVIRDYFQTFNNIEHPM